MIVKKIKAYGICLYRVEKDDIKILLCKSVLSKKKWGFLKGVQETNETNKQTAQREFFEESSIETSIKFFEKYFEQLNYEKDIGIYLVNMNKIKKIDLFFTNDILQNNYLSRENSKVKFFSIKQLPRIRKKQSKLIINIIDFLENKNLSH